MRRARLHMRTSRDMHESTLIRSCWKLILLVWERNDDIWCILFYFKRKNIFMHAILIFLNSRKGPYSLYDFSTLRKRTENIPEVNLLMKSPQWGERTHIKLFFGYWLIWLLGSVRLFDVLYRVLSIVFCLRASCCFPVELNWKTAWCSQPNSERCLPDWTCH